MSSSNASGEASKEVRAPEAMAGLAKGLAIIELFDGSREELTAADAARETNTTRATARRCLLTLENLGYVQRRADKKFAPCARMALLGRGYRSPESLKAGAIPLLNRLRDELQEPVALVQIDGTEVYVIARAEAERIVTTGVKEGGRIPVYCSATGRALVADFSQEDLNSLLDRLTFEMRTPKTCSTRERFMELVESARREGVAYCDEEIELGMRSMAIPVRDAAGKIRYALSSSTLSARTTLSEMEERMRPILERNVTYFEQLIAGDVGR